jgi:hypothetical protein
MINKTMYRGKMIVRLMDLDNEHRLLMSTLQYNGNSC